jgi:Fe-Mn family superoxide dismutase
MAAASSSRSVLGLRTALKSCRNTPQQYIRSRALHSLPPLPAALREGKGCTPLFSQKTINMLWNEWQDGLLKNLNDQVKGTKWENSSIVETVIGTARDPHEILAFNYASLALNNSFFFNNLKPYNYPAGATHWNDYPAPEPPKDLLEKIQNAFGSLAAFKLAFCQTAFGMSGSGYVWLVVDKNMDMGIIPTYGAGTILIQNRMQRDGARDEWMKPSYNEPTSPSSPTSPTGSLTSSRRMSTSAKVMAPYKSSSVEGIERRGEELYPLLCISVHERDWLFNHGCLGKELYLSVFWHCVDWDRVRQLYNEYKNAM